MNPVNLMLAQLDKSQDILDLRPRGQGFFNNSDSLIVLALVILLAAVLFLWAYFVRKRPRSELSSHALVPSRRSHRSHHESSRRSHGDGPGVRVRRRRRRSDDLPRNPTLGETGGLPPLRPEDPEDGASPLQSPPSPSSQT